MSDKKIKEMLKKLGRPSKYNEDILVKSLEYLVNFNKNNAYDEDEPHKFREAAPSVLGLAKYISISRETIYQWIKDEDKRQFSDIVSIIDSERELALINKSLFNTINPQITKLLLSQVGIIEKKEIKQDINVFDNMSDEELKRLAEED